MGRPAAWKKFLFATITALVGAGLAFGAGEILLRAIEPKSDDVRMGLRLPGSRRLYGLKPNLQTLQKGVAIRINSTGFREREYHVQKPPGVTRIVVLGDSFTLGVGVEFDRIFSKELEARLRRSGCACEVINFGVSGYNTAQELETLREVAAAYQPDLVIVGYVPNDTERVRRPGAAGEPMPAAHATFEARLSALHVRAREGSLLYGFLAVRVGKLLGLFGARYAVGGTAEMVKSYEGSSPGWVEASQALAGIRDETRRLGAELLVVVFPMILDFDSYPLFSAHAKVTKFCADGGIAVLDLLPVLQREKAHELMVLLDGHPNARAHGIFAAELEAHPLVRAVAAKDPAVAAGQ